MKKDKMVRVGFVDSFVDSILDTDLSGIPIFRSKGLQAHMMKQKHFKAVGYIDMIDDILSSPDYVGVTINNGVTKLEYIKSYKDNIILCAKLNSDGKSMYVATMYDIPSKKIDRFLHSGRIKRVDGDLSS